MKIWKIAVMILGIALLYNCKSDDDGSLLPQGEQNDLDDEALVKILNEYYFNENGVMTPFDDESTDDDDETPLMEYATQDPMGYWYVINPNVEATGASVTSNETDSILIQHTTYSFKAGKDGEGDATYSLSGYYRSTVNSTGLPEWDLPYYYRTLTVDTDHMEYYTIEGIVDGLKHFSATNREVGEAPPVKLQGVILVPSRLAFGRTFNRINMPYDVSFVMNFELYKIVPRNSN